MTMTPEQQKILDGLNYNDPELYTKKGIEQIVLSILNAQKGREIDLQCAYCGKESETTLPVCEKCRADRPFKGRPENPYAQKEGEKDGCPCHYVEPCHPDCTCVKPWMSRGCSRCAKYGSLEQRIEMAMQLAFPSPPRVSDKEKKVVVDDEGVWRHGKDVPSSRVSDEPPFRTGIRHPGYAFPDKVLDNCEHEWKEIESMGDNDVECKNCKCPGEVNRQTGFVYWPTT